jgi:hypothetical protein
MRHGGGMVGDNVAKADSKEQRQASGAPGLVGDYKKHHEPFSGVSSAIA